jgi:hypothetical protein
MSHVLWPRFPPHTKNQLYVTRCAVTLHPSKNEWPQLQSDGHQRPATPASACRAASQRLQLNLYSARQRCPQQPPLLHDGRWPPNGPNLHWTGQLTPQPGCRLSAPRLCAWHMQCRLLSSLSQYGPLRQPGLSRRISAKPRPLCSVTYLLQLKLDHCSSNHCSFFLLKPIKPLWWPHASPRAAKAINVSSSAASSKKGRVLNKARPSR